MTIEVSCRLDPVQYRAFCPEYSGRWTAPYPSTERPSRQDLTHSHPLLQEHLSGVSGSIIWQRFASCLHCPLQGLPRQAHPSSPGGAVFPTEGIPGLKIHIPCMSVWTCMYLRISILSSVTRNQRMESSTIHPSVFHLSAGLILAPLN